MRPSRRKHGISDRLHEALLKERTEDFAVLPVDVPHPKARALYEPRGYARAGEQQPFADSPVYAVVVKERLPGPCAGHAMSCTELPCLCPH